MSKAIIHSKITSKKLHIEPQDIIEIDSLIDSSKQFESTNKHRCMFHHTAGAFYMEKMFGINFNALENLRTKYNLPEEFIKDYQNQRQLDRFTGTELESVNGKRFDVRTVVEEHILQDFRGKFIPSFSDYLNNMETTPWMNNAIKPINWKKDGV